MTPFFLIPNLVGLCVVRVHFVELVLLDVGYRLGPVTHAVNCCDHYILFFVTNTQKFIFSGSVLDYFIYNRRLNEKILKVVFKMLPHLTQSSLITYTLTLVIEY